MRETVIIVPCFNPDEKFPALLRELLAAGFTRIVAVDDGSRPECRPLFDKARALGAVVLVHAVNQGKGRALKTAFHYALNQWGRGIEVVCADCDGQHAAADIVRTAERLRETPERLVMGCRSFDRKDIPLRSRMGNKLTRWVFQVMCGVRVSDTQTGLRGLSGKNAERFLSTKGEHYEYEMNMLIDAHEDGIRISEVPISTIYIEENAASHFNPLKDSLRIYSVFFKFIFSSLIGFAVDYVLFLLLENFLGGLFSPSDAPSPSLSLFGSILSRSACVIWISTFFSRVASSLVNYSINRRRVFRQEEGRSATMARYYVLCAFQMLASAGLVALLADLTHGPVSLFKLAVDLTLFFLSFQVQREWVFRKSRA